MGTPAFRERFFSSAVWQDKAVGRVTATGHDPDYRKYSVLLLRGHNVLLTKSEHFKWSVAKAILIVLKGFRPQALRFVDRAILFGHVKDDLHEAFVRF
jgi:hypothetical protein